MYDSLHRYEGVSAAIMLLLFFGGFMTVISCSVADKSKGDSAFAFGIGVCWFSLGFPLLGLVLDGIYEVGRPGVMAGLFFALSSAMCWFIWRTMKSQFRAHANEVMRTAITLADWGRTAFPRLAGGKTCLRAEDLTSFLSSGSANAEDERMAQFLLDYWEVIGEDRRLPGTVKMAVDGTTVTQATMDNVRCVTLDDVLSGAGKLARTWGTWLPAAV